MNYKLIPLIFASTFLIAPLSHSSSDTKISLSLFDNFFNTDKGDINKVETYYETLKSRVKILDDQTLIVDLFSQELSGHPGQSSNIVKVFFGIHSQYSKELLGELINHENFSKFPKIESLSKKISKEVVDKLKPIKTLMVINIRNIFTSRLSDMFDKYPQYSLQLLTYAVDLNIVDKQNIIVNHHEFIAQNQVELLKSEEGSSYELAIGALVLAAAGGGGGGSSSGSSTTTCGGGPCSPTSDANSYKTTEFNNQAGLAMVKAETLYSYGGSGTDIKVAVFDTGVLASHLDLSGRILSSDGYNLDTNASGVTTDGNGHGTHVSGIIAANKGGASGMHGVAYNAKIIPYKIFDGAGAFKGSDSKIADVFSRATAKGARIFNNSWGSSVTIKAATHKVTGTNSTSVNKSWIDTNKPLTVNQIQSSVNSGVVFVWAAGNSYFTEGGYRSGLPYYYPDMKKGYLSVMSLDTNGAESSFSNRCGVSADWCIAAPGGSIYSTYNNGSYTVLSGTSMAAPMVSGALAGLKSRFPSLSYHQVRDRLLATANSTGIYANTAIFGKGLMDLSAASSPVGVTMITTTTSDNGTVIASASSIATLSSEVFSVFADQIANNKIMLVDSFDRAAFYTDASAFIKSKKKSFNTDLESLFDQKNAINKRGVSYYTSKNGQYLYF